MRKTNKWLDHSENAKEDKFMKTTQFLKNVQNAKELASRFVYFGPRDPLVRKIRSSSPVEMIQDSEVNIYFKSL